MIALCAEHHEKADHGAFTVGQLRALKKQGRDRAEALAGRFDWMREKLLAVVGGNVYYDVPTPLEISGKPAIWFNRDEQGRFLLNVEMPSLSGEPRLRIEDNYWIEIGEPDDLECPPKGTLLAATYRNGDVIRVEFSATATVDALTSRYPFLPLLVEHGDEFVFPLAVVEIRLGVKASVLDLGPRGSRILVPGLTMTGSFMKGGEVGLSIG
jgi:hypothetical protein